MRTVRRLIDHAAAHLFVRRILTDPDSRPHGSLSWRYPASRLVNRAYWRHYWMRGGTAAADHW